MDPARDFIMGHAAQAAELARARGVRYLECSAKDGGGVEQAVHALVTAALRAMEAACRPPPPRVTADGGPDLNAHGLAGACCSSGVEGCGG